MNILLDTHVLLWHLTDNPKLDNAISQQIENPENLLFFSMASLWEIAIKTSIGKLKLDKSIENILSKEIFILDIKLQHITRVKDLPFHHKDPFDRLTISQALTEDLTIISDDHNFKLYDVKLF